MKGGGGRVSVVIDPQLPGSVAGRVL
jgi:hypothetical protein